MDQSIIKNYFFDWRLTDWSVCLVEITGFPISLRQYDACAICWSHTPHGLVLLLFCLTHCSTAWPSIKSEYEIPDWAHLAICLSHWVLFSFQNIWLRSEFIPPDQAGIALSLTDSQLWKSSIYHLNNMAMTLHLPRVESKWIGESISVICLVWWN